MGAGKKGSRKKSGKGRQDSVRSPEYRPAEGDSREVPGVPVTEARALALLGSMAELAENLRQREADLAGLHAWLGSPGDATMTLESGEEGRLDDPRVRAALQATAAGLLSYLDHWTGACAAVRAVASEGP